MKGGKYLKCVHVRGIVVYDGVCEHVWVPACLGECMCVYVWVGVHVCSSSSRRKSACEDDSGDG